MSDLHFTGQTPDDLAAKIKAHPFATVREQLMQKATLKALSKSIPLTPKKSGTLRRSETNRVEPGGLAGWIGTNVYYGPFVHNGTKNPDGTTRMAARPFFEQGIKAAQPEIEHLLQAAGDEYMESLT